MPLDSILLVGVETPKLGQFLRKLGHDVYDSNGVASMGELLQQVPLDLVVIDACHESLAEEILDFLRTDRWTKQVPIVWIAPDAAAAKAVEQRSLTEVETVVNPGSIGVLVSKIVTRLRLRKMAGADEKLATLSEMNARLRDLNERLLKDLEEARAIQESLIPAFLPKDPRFDLAVSYAPLEEVGGDWYYAQMLPSQCLSVQIADVAGHGLSAAFVGSMTKLALTVAATEEPAKLLATMNRLMTGGIPSGRFVTIFAYNYEPTTGRLQYARAGHTPALLLHHSNSKVVELKGDGFAVGFFEDSTYEACTEQLEPGDALVVFTDGVTEALNRAGQCYGYKRMGQLLCESSPNDDAEELLQRIIDDFEAFRDGRLLKDDITAIILKRVC